MAQPVARPLEDRARLGIVMMLAAWLLLSLVDTSVKWLVIAGIPVLQLAFMRYFVHFLIATGATLLIVYNAFALALFSIITRRISGVTPAETMQFWMGAMGTLVLAPGAIWVWQNPQTPRDWLILGAIGAWGWGGHELFARAHGFAEANALMPYSYAFILYLTTATWLVFGELPDGFTVLGAVVIVSSGLLIWWRENHKGAINVS